MHKQEPIYLKAITLRELGDVYSLKKDIKNKIILIVRITPLAQKDVEGLRKAVEELYSFTKDFDGDMVRLGDERIIVTPPNVKIWKSNNRLE